VSKDKLPNDSPDNADESLQKPFSASQSGLPLVYINILHWRGVDHTRRCIESVLKLKYDNFKILLIDNGSLNEETKPLLQLDTERLLWLRLPENKGFSGGHNAGIKVALEHNADFIWLLNNDATVETDCLGKLIQIAQKEDRVGALNAAVLDVVPGQNNNDPKPSKGQGVIDYRRGKTLLKAGPDAEFADCDWLAASNLLLRREAIEQTGAFDERYFLYFEDVELCHKLRLRGWRCLFVPGARITHVGGASTEDNLKHWRSYYYTRNRLLFFQTYANSTQRISSFFSIWMHLLRHCVSLSLKGKKGKKQLDAELQGARDFLAGRFGQASNLD
jgi:GT2 family glycosyltransferase